MQGDDEVLRTATSKAIRRIVPFTMLMFVLSFLDRVNVGFAKQGLQRDAGIGDYAFAMGLRAQPGISAMIDRENSRALSVP